MRSSAMNKQVASNLVNKVALVTGGSRGIGAAIAKRLAADGASVAITYAKDASAASAVVKAIEFNGGKAVAIQADAADAEAVKAAVEKTVATFGRLDVLVNNAGTAIPKPFEETTVEEMNRVLDINVRGVFIATQAALRHMKSGGRRIMNNSSVGERVLVPGLVAYSATKGAVKIFTQALSRELGSRGIAVTNGKVLVRITAAGVTPLDHTILSGKFHGSKPPLVLGNEGAGVVEDGGGTDFPVGSRVMFFGAYGAFEDGTYREWVSVRKEDLCLIPDNVDDVSAAGIPVAYLTAQVALTLAGFRAGKTVLAPAIGGSIGNAVTQLARALGAKHAMSSTTNHAKAEQAKALGFNEVVDTSSEKLGDGVRRITSGYGADIVVDGVGGEVLSEALGVLALGGSLTTLGYSASRKTTIDVTDLIVPQASIRSLNMFLQPQSAITQAWNVIVSLLKSGAIKPIVAKTFPLTEAADALRYLIEGRPFGRVVLTI